MQRKYFRYFLLSLFILLSSSGCATYRGTGGGVVASPSEKIVHDRILTWNAELSLEVSDLTTTGDAIRKEVESRKGYVERTYENEKYGTDLSMRIPADQLKDTMRAIESMGEVVSRSISAQDVTDSYMDIEASIKNKIILRDELRRLLSRAQAVAEIVAVQKELSTVQAELDALEGRFQGMKSDVAYSHLKVNLEKKVILGPLGLIVKGVSWCVEKLFYLSD